MLEIDAVPATHFQNRRSSIRAHLAAFSLAACSSAAPADLPPYASAEPILEATIFGRGAISSELPEFASSFSPDGSEIYFNRMPADRSRIELLVSRYNDGSWGEAELLPFSGTYRDVDPWISYDGTRLYFSSDRPREGTEPKEDFDTWYAERSEDGWSDPVNLGPSVNTDGTEIFVSMTRSGTLFFRRSWDDGRGIFSAASSGDSFEDPVMLTGLGLEQPGNPLIAPDGSFLIMSTTVEGGGENCSSRSAAMIAGLPSKTWAPL